MNDPVQTTFRFLARTKNPAALDVLIAGLDCPVPAARQWAIRAILERRDRAGHEEVFRRLSKLDGQGKSVVAQYPDRLVGPASAALQDRSPDRVIAACKVILEYRLYGAMPALVTWLERHRSAEAQLVAETALELAVSLYKELSDSPAPARRRDLQTIRRQLTSTLEKAVRRFAIHGRKQLVEAFLILAKPQNMTLRYLLQRPEEAGYGPLVEALSTSPQGGVIRLLLGFLEDPPLPQPIKQVLAERSDLKFVENLALTVGPKPSRPVNQALGQIEEFRWAKAGAGIFQQLSGPAQAGAAAVLAVSAQRQNRLHPGLAALLRSGKVEGRRAAIRAVAQIPGPQADQLILEALNDPDPAVCAVATGQLRPRRIQGALSLLVRLSDSPHQSVREAVSQALPEFTVRRFLANFDGLDESIRPAAGQLVRKIDPSPIRQLVGELRHVSPVRRRRAVMAAQAMNLVAELESVVIGLLSDEDHLVRIEAARALAECSSQPTVEALREALADSSPVVQEAAEESLQRVARSLAPAESESVPVCPVVECGEP
ncbi:MAG: HEAT repeat domain-containing protein [Thermoguttaceae bacterium]